MVGLGAGRLPAVNPRLPASCRRDRARIGGASPTAVLNYWLRHRIDGYQLAAWGEIGNYRARLAIEQAVIADGAVYAAVTIPAPDMANFAPGSSALWTLASAPKGSHVYGLHAAALVGYDAIGPYLVAWGTVVHVTWAWWDTWATDAYAVIPAYTIEPA